MIIIPLYKTSLAVLLPSGLSESVGSLHLRETLGNSRKLPASASLGTHAAYCKLLLLFMYMQSNHSFRSEMSHQT